MANPITGGVTSDGIVLTNDNLTIESGATVKNVTANSGGVLYLLGYSESATLNSGAQMTIYTGGSADRTVVNLGANLFASYGGLARQTKLAGGYLYLLDHSTASDTEVKSGGFLNVLAGASAAGVTVGPGGALNINPGATATQVVENGGIVYVGDGANVVFARHTIEKLSLAKGTATLHSGTTAAQAVITQDGKVDVYQGGLFLSGTLSACTTAGGLCISSGGLASAVTVASGGLIFVLGGASVDGLTVNAGGSVSIQPGATVTGLLDDGGNVYIQEGATVSYAANVVSGMILSKGSYIVRSGTTLTNPLVTRDGNMTVNEGGLFLSGAVTSLTTMGGFCVNSGGTASATRIGQGGIMYVVSGGSAVTCELADGTLRMNQGAVASGLTVTAGDLTVAAEAILSNSFIKGGTVYSLTGSKAENITLSTAGEFTVCSGAVANGVIVSSGGTLAVQSGGTVTGLKNNGGFVAIADGATVTFVGNVIDNMVVSTGSYNVFSGTTLTNPIVTRDGKVNVNEGGLFLSGAVTSLTTAGGFCVSSGGVASATRIGQGGIMYVVSGGSAVSCELAGGTLSMNQGAVASGLTVTSGSLTVAADAIMSNSFIKGGTVYSLTGSKAENITLSTAGELTVCSGAVANGMIVSSGGTLAVQSGGTVTGLKNNGGFVSIADGATVTFAANVIDNMIVSSGTYNVFSGTILSNAILTRDGKINVNDGGVVDGATVSACNAASYMGMYVFSGGTAVNTQIKSGGAVYLYSDGSAFGGVVSSGGVCQIRDLAYAKDLVVMPGGTLGIAAGATVIGLKDNGGTVSIADGANVTFAPNVIENLVVNDGAYSVRSGTTLTKAVVSGSGIVNIHEGGVVSSANVKAGGMVFALSGGTALDCVIANGTLRLLEGGFAKGTRMTGGGINVEASAIMTDSVISGGTVYVLAQGRADATELGNGANFTVCAGAVANGLTVQPGATLFIQSGATVTGLLDNGGFVSIADGASVTFAENIIDGIVVSDGTYSVRSGTTLTKPVVTGSGAINILDGGVVASANVKSGGVIFALSGGSALDCDVNNGTLRLMDGGCAKGTTLNSGAINVEANAILTDSVLKGGTIYVLAQGTVNSTAIGGSAKLTVCSGASANALTVQPGASLFIQNGAKVTGLKDTGGYISIESGADVTFAPNVIDSLVVSDGEYFIHSGTTLTKAVIQGRGVVNVLEGGVVASAVVNSCSTNATTYAGLFVSGGGTAIQTTVNSGGVLYVYDGGFASGGVVSSGASCQVRSGGAASDLTVRGGGSMSVASGAAAYDILEDGGTVDVTSGAIVTFVERVVSGSLINNGATTIHQGTTMAGAVIQGTGKLNVRDGGKAVSTTVNACDQDGGLVLYSGGTAIGNTMNSNGFAYIFEGATAIDNTINPGGSMTVFSGAVMRNVNVLSDPNYINDPKNALGGTLYLSSGAVLTGRIRVGTEGSYIFINGLGVTIDFDVTEINPSGDQEVLLDDFERIRPQPKEALDHVANFTVTVSDDQSIGTYKLALANKLPDNFPLITVRNTSGTVLGQIQVTATGGGTFTYNGVEYSIDHRMVMTSQTTGYVTLFLHIGDGANAFSPLMPTVSADVTTLTNASVTVAASFDTTIATRQYSFDGTNWMTYGNGVTMTENGRVYFRGLNKDGASGIASYTVRNIDRTAPTAPAGLIANVSGRTVTMNWRPAADDLAGVREYIVTYSRGDRSFTAKTTDTQFVLEDADYAAWQWSVQAVDNAGNLSSVSVGEAFVVADPDTPNPPAPTERAAKFDVDGNGVSDVMFVWTGNNYMHGYWMNGTNEWRSTGSNHPAEWENLGCCDMTGDGKADSVLVGNVEVGGVKGAYIGYYADAVDAIDGSTWVNIDYLNNQANIAWKNKIGNLTGGNANSIVWYAPELYTLGAWTDGTSNWVTMTGSFGGSDWTLVGCGDFDGDGKDSVVMSGAGGTYLYTADLDGTVLSMGAANWSGWDVRAIGDFAGDGRDDMVLFHQATGTMVMLKNGSLDDYATIGQLDPVDWFVAGCGDYNGDGTDDLLVRQYSTGMLGYYSNGDQTQWNVLGYGVDMSWTVIA